VPLYEYKCLKCGRHSDKIENVRGPHLKKCPHCKGKVESVITAPSIQFKGSGWYVTDYAGKSKSDDGGSGEKSTRDSKESAAKETSSKDSSAKEKSASESTSKETSSKDSKEGATKDEKKPAKKK
jgi:putative FmdB family regulatory protein